MSENMEKKSAQPVVDGNRPGRGMNIPFMELFNAICDPVFVLDTEGRYIEVNQSACRVLGYSREELLRMSPADLDAPECAARVPEKLRSIKELGRVTFECAKMCKDGTMLKMEVTAGLANLDGREVIVSIARDITARKQAENQLVYQKRYFEALFRSSTDAIISLNSDHLVVDINPRFEELFGYSLDELEGRDIDDFIQPEDCPDECRIFTTEALKGHSITMETVRRRKNGDLVHVLVRGTPIFMENRIIGVLGIYTDITDRITSNKKLLEAHKLQQDIIDFLPDPTFVVNREGKVIAWNRAMEKMSGVKKEDMIGRGNWAYSIPFYGYSRPVLLDYFISGEKQVLHEYDTSKLNENKLFAQGYAPRAYRGRGAYLWITASPLFDKDGNLIGAIESIRDITEQKEREQRLEFLSWHDQLTGMYNRTFFEHKIEHIDLARNLPITIITCDVDGLKMVNDTMGHATGDKLLQSAAVVIRDSIRSSDIAARIGGDEFAILLTRTDQATGNMVRSRIREAIEKHNRSNNMTLSMSIGMSTAGDTGKDITELYKEADNMMYREKLRRTKNPRCNPV